MANDSPCHTHGDGMLHALELRRLKEAMPSLTQSSNVIPVKQWVMRNRNRTLFNSIGTD